MFRKFLANTALLAVSLILSGAVLVAAGEIYMRATYGALEPGPGKNMYRFHDQRGWALVPGDYEYLEIKSFQRVRATVNDLGVRSPAVSLDVPPGKTRVTVIGDSFVFSNPLTDGKRFTESLDQLAGDDVEIVNVGVPGYGTGQQILLLDEMVAQGYDPGKLVIHILFTNDSSDNFGFDYGTLKRLPHKPRFWIDDSGALASEPPVKPEGAGRRRGWLDSSLFVAFVKSRATSLMAAQPALLDTLSNLGLMPALPRVPGIVAGWYGEQWREMWDVNADILGYMANRVRGYGDTEFAIAYMPSPLQVRPTFRSMLEDASQSDARFAAFLAEIDRPQRMLADYCTATDIACYDATATLQNAGTDELLYFPTEGHLTEAGSALYAQFLFDQILAPILNDVAASHITVLR